MLEFTRDEHRYRAELRSVPGEPSGETTLPQAFWYVSVDGEPPGRAFEADVRDEDTEAFRLRIVAAARGDRVGREPLRSSDVPPNGPAYEKEPDQAEKHHGR
jgi:hypothetical protein